VVIVFGARFTLASDLRVDTDRQARSACPTWAMTTRGFSPLSTLVMTASARA
jgi:hypothetical protein